MKTQFQPWVIALVFVTIDVSIVKSEVNSYKRVCYHTNWSVYRRDIGYFTANKIDPFMCTHLIFAFGDFDAQGTVQILDNQKDLESYEQFRNLKQRNPELRTLLAIGGWNFGSVRYSEMVKNSVTRNNFVSSTVGFLRIHGFDGLDIDWEYPAERGGAPEDKQNLVTLCKELKDAFTAEAQDTGRESLLLTAAVPAGIDKVKSGYDVPALNEYFDFINIMTYDFHGGWETETGQNSPLYAAPIYTGDNVQLNINASANYWNEAGVPKDKLIIGLATYGRTFTLTSGSYGVGAPAIAGRAGTYTQEAGFWSYYEICLEIETGLGTVHYDAQQEVPYYVKDNLWVGYDNEQSIRSKTKWIKESGFGGVMVWALDLDDFNTVCKSSTQPYPLINTAIEELGVNITQPSPAGLESQVNANPATTTTQDPVQPSGTSNSPAQELTCLAEGDYHYPDPNDCTKYYRCTEGVRNSMNCNPGLHWDPVKNICNWPEDANCQAG